MPRALSTPGRQRRAASTHRVLRATSVGSPTERRRRLVAVPCCRTRCHIRGRALGMGAGRRQRLASAGPPALLPVLVVRHGGCRTAGSAGGGCHVASEGAGVKRLAHGAYRACVSSESARTKRRTFMTGNHIFQEHPCGRLNRFLVFSYLTYLMHGPAQAKMHSRCAALSFSASPAMPINNSSCTYY
jgi:hypothetical protein